jgi:hypothetical protein
MCCSKQACTALVGFGISFTFCPASSASQVRRSRQPACCTHLYHTRKCPLLPFFHVCCGLSSLPHPHNHTGPYTFVQGSFFRSTRCASGGCFASQRVTCLIPCFAPSASSSSTHTPRPYQTNNRCRCHIRLKRRRRAMPAAQAQA